LSKTCSARPEPLDLKKAVSAAFGSAREAFLGILILYLSVSTDVSREIQHGCTRSFNGTRSMDEIHDHNLSYGRFYNSNSSVYEFLPVDSMPVHRYIQSNPPSFETFICAIGNLRILFWAASTTHLFLAVAELWFLLRFVCPSAGAILLHCTGLIVLSTFLYWVLFDERISRNPIASNYRHPIPCSLFTTTVLLYWNIVFLGNTILSWGVRNLRLCVRNLSMGVWGLAALARAAWGRRRRAGPRPTSLNDSNAVPATIKYGEKYLAFDSIPRNAQCGDLIPFLELRLGSKVPRNARLMVNGRFLKMHETVDEAGLIGHSTIEVSVPIRGGMNCFKSCFRPNLPSDSESSRLRAIDGAPGAASPPAQASPTSPPPAPRHGQRLESGPADQAAVPNFEKSTPPPVTKQGLWSIPCYNLRPLLEKIGKDMKASTGSDWDGYSETLRSYLVQNKIDPRIKYGDFYVNERHTVAGSYTWRGTTLHKFADKADDPINRNKRIWIDVLVVPQFSIVSSPQVIATTDINYLNCEVWIFLDGSYLLRGWCLAEAAQYSTTASCCNLSVSGSAELKPNMDFFGGMQAGMENDIPLIQKYILEKYGSKENFNKIIDHAIVRLSAWSLIYQGRYAEALQACKQELDVLDGVPSDNSASITATQANMAICYEKLGEFERSLELHQQVLESKIRAVGPDHVSVAETHVSMGVVCMEQGDYEKALFHYDTALPVFISQLGNAHVSVAATYTNIGNVESKRGNLQKALELYEKALDIEIKSLGNSHVSVAQTNGNIGNVYDSLGDYEKALFHHNTALSIFVSQLGNSHVSVAATYKNIGVVERKRGNLQKALELYEKALDIEIKSLGNSHVSVAMTKENIGIVLKRLGKRDQAKIMYQEAHEIFLRSLGPEHFNTKKAARGLAEF
jgi:tetratricopeptide (TPR) repeat protein